MSFWDSKLIKDAENGVLPQVPVSIEPASIIMLSLALLTVGVVLILISNIFKHK